MTTKTKTATKKAPAKSSKAAKPAAKKPAKAAGKNGDGKLKKLSALDAAAKVLAESKEPLNTRQMVETMAKKGLWTSPGGATPHATLYSAILREINAKAKDARFKKTDRGHFVFNG
jgi:HB1, ASXL, restriction endonuclease HTH domain